MNIYLVSVKHYSYGEFGSHVVVAKSPSQIRNKWDSDELMLPKESEVWNRESNLTRIHKNKLTIRKVGLSTKYKYWKILSSYFVD